VHRALSTRSITADIPFDAVLAEIARSIASSINISRHRARQHVVALPIDEIEDLLPAGGYAVMAPDEIIEQERIRDLCIDALARIAQDNPKIEALVDGIEQGLRGEDLMRAVGISNANFPPCARRSSARSSAFGRKSRSVSIDEGFCLRFPFPAVHGEKVTAAFDDDCLISDSGVLVLAQAERMMGICERLAACITDPRAVARMIYRLEDIPRARACGCLARLSGLSPGAALASPPTMSRGENAPITQELVKMLTAMIDISSASHPIARAAVRLDIDDTCDVVRGCQQLSFWNGRWRALFPADPCL
jgi:hypothetical protein